MTSSSKKSPRSTVREPVKIGVVGLGRRSGGLTLQAMEKGMRVAGIDSRGAPPDMLKAGMVSAKSLADFTGQLNVPGRGQRYGGRETGRR